MFVPIIVNFACIVLNVKTRIKHKERADFFGSPCFYWLSYKCCGEACEAVSRFVGWKIYLYERMRFLSFWNDGIPYPMRFRSLIFVFVPSVKPFV